MSLFFPDLNVWLALSVAGHSHSDTAWQWIRMLPLQTRLIFSRYTHIGLLRLLTNPSVMGQQTLSLGKAWRIYDRWIQDPRIEFYPEPPGIDAVFRQATAPFAAKQATKWVGDCYLLAYAKQTQATLVTFDGALHAQARKQGHLAIMPVHR